MDYDPIIRHICDNHMSLITSPKMYSVIEVASGRSVLGPLKTKRELMYLLGDEKVMQEVVNVAWALRHNSSTYGSAIVKLTEAINNCK